MARPGSWENVILWSADTPARPLVVDPGDGGLLVHVANGSTGGTAAQDESAFTAGSSDGTPLMVEYGGQLLIAAGDANRAVQVAGAGTAAQDESAFTVGSSKGTPLMVEFGGQLLVAAGDASRRLQVAGVLSTTPPTAATSTSAGPTAIGTVSAQALAANASRVRLVLQNVGTTQLFILEGSGSASSTNYTYILPMGGTTRDGSSPVLFDTVWKGAIQWASSAGGGLGIITEETT